MKIIERGIPPENKIYIISCHNCRTKFEFEQHEGKIICDQRDGDYVSIKCPICTTSCSHKL